MNKISKALVMTGMALVAGATMSAGPAFAASAAPAAPQSATVKAPAHAQVVGFYRSVFACHAAGQQGERRDRWADHSCVQVRTGFRRGPLDGGSGTTLRP